MRTRTRDRTDGGNLVFTVDRVQGQVRGWELHTWPDGELLAQGPAETAEVMGALFERPIVEAGLHDGLRRRRRREALPPARDLEVAQA